MKSDQILKRAEAFEKLAAFDFNAICKNYGAAIQREVAAGIAAINKLVTTNRQAAESRGIEALDDLFAKIGESGRQLAQSQSADGYEITLRDLKAYLGNATFYTSSFNAGTGYDPATRIGGAGSPAAYINRIYTMVQNLEKWSKQAPPPGTPTKPRGVHDPSIPPKPTGSGGRDPSLPNV